MCVFGLAFCKGLQVTLVASKNLTTLLSLLKCRQETRKVDVTLSGFWRSTHHKTELSASKNMNLSQQTFSEHFFGGQKKTGSAPIKSSIFSLKPNGTSLGYCDDKSLSERGSGPIKSFEGFVFLSRNLSFLHTSQQKSWRYIICPLLHWQLWPKALST